jgi:protein SCO1/2
MIRKALYVVFFTLVLAGNVWSQDKTYGILEKTGQILPEDVMITNEDSVRVRFGDLIDRPTLLSFVYYQCPGLCSPVMNGIAEIIQKSDLQIGKDYRVITISVNYKEPVSLARSKKASYMRTLHNANAQKYWQFYVADSNAIKTLTDAAGWEFKRTGNDFVHSAATILITPHRKISQYFYGTFILPMHFHLAVNDARGELTDASRMKDQMYCLNYDPLPNKSFSLIVNSAGIGILVLGAILFIWLSLSPAPRHLSKDKLTQ